MGRLEGEQGWLGCTYPIGKVRKEELHCLGYPYPIWGVLMVELYSLGCPYPIGRVLKGEQDWLGCPYPIWEAAVCCPDRRYPALVWELQVLCSRFLLM